MPSRETLLIAFCFLLIAYVFWIDLRPYVMGWLRRKRRRGKESLDIVVSWWIAERSAWGRWQRAQGAAMTGIELMDMHHYLHAVIYAAQNGDLTITARKKSEIQREKLTQDFWRVATLEIIKDNIRIWTVFIRPFDGLSDEAVSKITEADYIDLTADWSKVLELWPEHDRRMDSETKALLRKNKKAKV